VGHPSGPALCHPEDTTSGTPHARSKHPKGTPDPSGTPGASGAPGAPQPLPAPVLLRRLAALWGQWWTAVGAFWGRPTERRYLALTLLALLLPRLPPRPPPLCSPGPWSSAWWTCSLPRRRTCTRRVVPAWGAGGVGGGGRGARGSARSTALERPRRGALDVLSRTPAVRRLAAGLRPHDHAAYSAFLRRIFLTGSPPWTPPVCPRCTRGGSGGGWEGPESGGEGGDGDGAGEGLVVPRGGVSSSSGTADVAWQQWALEQMLRMLTSAGAQKGRPGVGKQEQGKGGKGGKGKEGV